MTVTCKMLSLGEDDIRRMGVPAMFAGAKYSLTEGRLYTVLGLTFHLGSRVFGNAPVLDVIDDSGRLAMVPVALFEIMDGRPSKFWRFRHLLQTTLALWPEEFFQEYFHDDLSEGVSSVKTVFRSVVQKIEDEVLHFQE